MTDLWKFCIIFSAVRSQHPFVLLLYEEILERILQLLFELFFT